MPYIIIGFAIVALVFIKVIYDEQNSKKRLTEKLQREWGQIPDYEYTSEKFKSIRYYYQTQKDETLDVDDITWNDIDMDQIYMLLNNTGSAIGEEYLYSLLRKLEYSNETLLERNRLIELFQKNPEKRLSLQKAIANMGKMTEISVYEYINRTDNISKHNPVEHYLYAFGLIFSIVLCFSSKTLTMGVLGTVFFIAHNILKYYKRKAEIEKYFSIFSYIIKMLNSMKKIVDLNMPEISEYADILKNAEQSFRKFKKGSFFVLSGSNMNGGIGDFILDYFRMLFHIDLIKFDSMLSEVRKNKEVLNQIYSAIGTLDCMLAVASFRTFLNEEYSLPQLSNTGKPFLEVEEVYHPLIADPVKNSISEKKGVLITGSNASGKSTFIKTMALNAILSQTIFTSLSKSYKANFFMVYSSMALRDDLFSKESYYIVEIKSLKRILDRLSDEIPMLCFVDEVLRGTNTLERIAASSQILYSLAKKNALPFAATHDIELTHILEKAYSNYHFQEKIIDNDILFDYVLQEGRAVSRNAIKLLGIMGYGDEIIEQAANAANEFLETGVWKEIQ